MKIVQQGKRETQKDCNKKKEQHEKVQHEENM